jgi:hypothetical protein
MDCVLHSFILTDNLDMKRTQTSIFHHDASILHPYQPKRAKGIKSCGACRKAKTRCEILEAIADEKAVRCHRCKTIRIPCTFSDVDQSLVLERCESGRTPTGLLESFVSSRSRTISLQTPTSDSSLGSSPADSLVGNPNDGNGCSGPNNTTHKSIWLWSFIEGYEKYDWYKPLAAFHELSWSSAEISSNAESALNFAVEDSSINDVLHLAQVETLLRM